MHLSHIISTFCRVNKLCSTARSIRHHSLGNNLRRLSISNHIQLLTTSRLGCNIQLRSTNINHRVITSNSSYQVCTRHRDRHVRIIHRNTRFRHCHLGIRSFACNQLHNCRSLRHESTRRTRKIQFHIGAINKHHKLLPLSITTRNGLHSKALWWVRRSNNSANAEA